MLKHLTADDLKPNGFINPRCRSYSGRYRVGSLECQAYNPFATATGGADYEKSHLSNTALPPNVLALSRGPSGGGMSKLMYQAYLN